MKKIYNYLAVAVVGLLSIVGCEKNSEIDYSLANSGLEVPMGEEGSVDRKIYEIFKKYSVIIKYEFDAKEMHYLWTGAWSRRYAPANLSDNKKYVEKFVDAIKERVLDKYEVDFIKSTFPLKIFLVDSISSGLMMDEKPKWESMLTNQVNSIAIAKVGEASDRYGEKEWNTFGNDVVRLFTLFFYNAMEVKPVSFFAIKHTKPTFPILKDPELLEEDQTKPVIRDANYAYSCKMAGYILGRLNTTYLIPLEENDFSDFTNYLTTTAASKMIKDFGRFELLRKRAIALERYLRTEVKIDVIGTQNNNNPNDKLPADFFETLM